MDSSSFIVRVDSRLQAACQHLRLREQNRLKLTSYSQVDYKPGAVGAEEIERLLNAVMKEEKLSLTELVFLRDEVAAYCRASGTEKDLRAADEFRAIQSAKTIVSGCPDSKQYYTIISKIGGGPAGQDSIHDVRFFVELGTSSYQVLELVQDLLQFWEIFLRHHTNFDLKDFSRDIRAQLLGRISDTVFCQAGIRQLVPVSEPASVSDSVEVLQAEIITRLENVAFYLEEREILRPGLAKYTGRTFGDPSNKNAKRDAKRIRNVETSLLYELVHLADSVRKWLDKQGRVSELTVMERFRPYRIGANLVNVLKHGVRGRNHDCAVIDYSLLLFKKTGKISTPDDSLGDIIPIVNYNGELFSLTEMIEDISQLWELFLRHHSPLSLTEFQVRLGRILLSRKGMSTYTFTIPDLEVSAQQEADRRKRLDLK